LAARQLHTGLQALKMEAKCFPETGIVSQEVKFLQNFTSTFLFRLLCGLLMFKQRQSVENTKSVLKKHQ
jgi:hypothetical protein